MGEILKLSNAIFSLIGWAYIMFKAGGWADNHDVPHGEIAWKY